MKIIYRTIITLVGGWLIAIGINIFVELGLVFVLGMIPMVLSNMFSCASAPAVDFSIIDDIVAYFHGNGSIRIVFTVYLLGIILSAIISSLLLFWVCRVTKGSKVLSLLMSPVLAIYFLKCCMDVFASTNPAIAEIVSKGGMFCNVVSVGAIIVSLLLNIGVVAASWNRWGID